MQRFFKTVTFIVISLWLNMALQAQDTIRVMQYNILNYGNLTSFCTATNNGVEDKDGYFKTVAKHILPDVIAINEMGSNAIYAQRILQNVLNTDSVTYYRAAGYTNTTSSSIVNMLFYNDDKLSLASENVISHPLRDMNAYKLFYDDPLLASGADTVFFTVINAHLKAGSTSSDQLTRAEMTSNIMNYLNSLGVKDNYLVLGDFNSRSSNEQAIQNFLTPSNQDIKLFDPINSLGTWNNTSSFANVHTQSTRTSSGCAAGGGMDDRFDMILASEYIMGDSAKVQYLPGSYRAVGQDGNRFNSTVISGTNQDVPAAVAQALFNMSDHLPVTLDLELDVTRAITKLTKHESESSSMYIPEVWNDIVSIKNLDDQSVDITIFDIRGSGIDNFTISGLSEYQYNHFLQSGMYLIQWKKENGQSGRSKFVKFNR